MSSSININKGDDMYYVYALIDVRTSLPFYIGKGKKGNDRHLDYFHESIDSSQNRHKTFKIEKLKSLGYDIPTVVIEDDIKNEEDAYQIETSYIQKYGRENIDPGGILTNICLDNRPPSWKGKKQSPAHILNRVNSYKDTVKKNGRPPVSAETRRKISRPGPTNPFYGKKHTLENRLAHSQRMKGNKNNSKKYVFVSPNGIENLVIGSFYQFCNENNLTISTMEKALQRGTVPQNGRCKGWKVWRIENE